MKKFFIRLIVVLILISTLLLLGNANNKPISNVPSSPVVPLAFFTAVDTPKGTIYLYINQDYINFNAVETPYYSEAPIIKKEDYPKLFKQGVASASAQRVEYYKESRDGENYIKLSNIQPDHGGFSDVYAILVDPFTGVIKESKSIDNYSGKAIF